MYIYIYIYIYIFMCMYVCMFINIYIYIERERDMPLLIYWVEGPCGGARARRGGGGLASGQDPVLYYASYNVYTIYYLYAYM